MHKKKSGIIGITIMVILLIILVILSNINVEKFSSIENAIYSLSFPIQNGLTYLKNKLAGNNTFFSNIDVLKSENEELKTKNSEYEKALRELEIIKAENWALKEYMKMAEKYDSYSTIPAYVINKDISNYTSTIIINIGELDGISENMTVISEEGLVGHVISVTKNTAKVQTIIDTASQTSATISTTRDGIILKGMLDGRNLKALYVPTEASLIQGDRVETSGMGGIYEKGITIGTIKEIINTKNITNRYALIETAVNFDKLETVLVIKK